MLAIRSLFKANSQILKNVTQQRNMSVIAIPSRKKVSRAEVIVLSTLMVIGWSAVPAWVLVNIKNYRHDE